MKKTISVVLALCILCSLYIAPPVSAAAIPEDFDVFYYNDFGEDITYADGGKTSTFTNGGTATAQNGVLHCVVASGVKSNSYVDFNNTKMAKAQYLIAEAVVTPIKVTTNTNISIFDSKNSAGTWRGGPNFTSANVINFPTTSNGTVTLGTWTANVPVRISIAYNLVNSTADVYIDGVKVKTGLGVKNVKPYVFRLDLTSQDTGTGLEFDIDNVMMYSGTKLRDASEVKSYTHNSVMDSEITARKSLGNSSAYTVESNYYYTNGEKKTYTADNQKPIFYGEGAYVSDEFLSQILGLSITASSSSKAVTVNGKTYMPAEDAAKAMGKEFLYDDRGYFILSDEKFPYVTTNHFKDLYDKDDVIYRYLYFANPTGAQMIADYNSNSAKGKYPRFLFTDDDVTYMKAQVKAKSADWVKAYSAKTDGGGSNSVLHMAETYCVASFNDTSNYYSFFDEEHMTSESKRHSNSSILKDAMESLAFAYHISGASKYAARAVEIMDVVTGWSSVEANGELTRGQWAMGLAMGYDAFYDYIVSTSGGAEKLASYRQAVIDKLLVDAAKAYRNQKATKWIIIDDNFNGVVSSGVMGVLIAMGQGLQTEYADYGYLLENVVKTMEIAASTYHPDGAYYEGLGYGDYNMAYFTRTLNAMYNCFGTDYGISNARGLDEVAKSSLYLQSSKYAFNFHDSGTDAGMSDMAVTFTYRHGKLEHSAMLKQEAELRGKYLGAFPLLQYEKAKKIYGTPDTSDYPLDAYFKTIGTGTFRNTFNSKTPIFAGYHGGWTTISHGSLDVGSFIFEENGVMWARDIGGEGDYPSGYFTSNGYKYYRKRPEGENCVVINPQVDSATYHGQAFDTTSKLIRWESVPRGGFSAFDLTDVYGRDVNKYHRGYYFGDDRRTYTVQDEITLKDTSELYWFMHTPATITINSPTSATLTYGTKQLNVEVYCSEEGYSLLDMDPAPLASSPTPPAANSANTGRKLAIHCPNASGDVTISVKLIPVNDTYTPDPHTVTPIENWSVKSGSVETPLVFTGLGVSHNGKLAGVVQLPESTVTAQLIIDNGEPIPIEVKPGQRYSVSGIAANMRKGSHKVALKVVLADGEEKFAYRRYRINTNDVAEILYEHDLSSFDDIDGSSWKFDYIAPDRKFDNGYAEITTGSRSNYFVEVDAPSAVTGKIRAECDFKTEDPYGLVHIYMKNSSKSSFPSGVYLFRNGYISDTTIPTEADKWYHLVMEIDTSAGTYSLYIDDVCIVNGETDTSATSMKSVYFQYFKKNGSSEHKIAFRNLKISSLQEIPATVDLEYSGTTATATFNVTDKTLFPSGEACIILASYDDEKMLDIKTFDGYDISTTTTATQSVNFTGDVKYVRAMLFDASDILTPICESDFYVK